MENRKRPGFAQASTMERSTACCRLSAALALQWILVWDAWEVSLPVLSLGRGGHRRFLIRPQTDAGLYLL